MILDEPGAGGGEPDGDEAEHRQDDGKKRHGAGVALCALPFNSPRVAIFQACLPALYF